MKIIHASIVLNEAEFIRRSINQHMPMCDHWIFVEGADELYPKHRVTHNGLSSDGTFVEWLGCGETVRGNPFISHGWAKNKSELRNCYAERIDEILEESGEDAAIVIVIDIDEFLTREDHQYLVSRVKSLGGPGAYRIPHIHYYPDDSKIVIGSYADVTHDRAYWWPKGARYRENHNHPCMPDGQMLNQVRYVNEPRKLFCSANGAEHRGACWLHYGFCKSRDNVGDKNLYYVNRGEAVDRPHTTIFRAGLLSGNMPPGVEVLDWCGKVPEVMQKTEAA